MRQQVEVRVKDVQLLLVLDDGGADHAGPAIQRRLANIDPVPGLEGTDVLADAVDTLLELGHQSCNLAPGRNERLGTVEEAGALRLCDALRLDCSDRRAAGSDKSSEGASTHNPASGGGVQGVALLSADSLSVQLTLWKAAVMRSISSASWLASALTWSNEVRSP